MRRARRGQRRVGRQPLLELVRGPVAEAAAAARARARAVDEPEREVPLAHGHDEVVVAEALRRVPRRRERARDRRRLDARLARRDDDRVAVGLLGVEVVDAERVPVVAADRDDLCPGKPFNFAST